VDYFTRIAGLPAATAYLKNGGTNFAVGGSTSELLLPYLASLYGVQIDLIDVNTLFTKLVNAPGAYGFKNSTGEAYNASTGKEVKHPNVYVFWDGFHPTTRVHKLAAEAFENAAAAATLPLVGANP
jgi:phospholipase/lecithinase/hemolysin